MQSATSSPFDSNELPYALILLNAFLHLFIFVAAAGKGREQSARRICIGSRVSSPFFYKSLQWTSTSLLYGAHKIMYSEIFLQSDADEITKNVSELFQSA